MEKRLIPQGLVRSDAEKAEIAKLLEKLSQAQAAEFGLDVAINKRVEYPSNMCAHCYARIGTVGVRINLLTDDEDPDAIWIGFMMCERCNRLMRKPLYSQSVIQKVADSLTFWLYSQGKDWVAA